jgi:hypothetical protein
MQAIAEAVSYGGGLAYIVLLLGVLAFPVSITALIISLASKNRKLGLVFGIIATGLAALTFLVGLAAYFVSMSQAESALAGGFVPPESVAPLAAKAVGMAASIMALGAILSGLPFVLGVLALSRAAVRPLPGDEVPAAPIGGRAGAVVSAILPGAFAVIGLIAMVAMQGGPEGLARMTAESGGLGMVQFSFFVMVTVVISILAPKAARGRRVLVAPLLLLASLPWLISFSSYLGGCAQALDALESAAPEQQAALLARGIAESLGGQMLGSMTSAWLLLALGLGLALGARGQRAEGRTGPSWLLGALAGIPLLIVAGMALAGVGATGMILALGAVLGLVITMLGTSGLGDDPPHHRSVSLGVGAALAAGLACSALAFAVAGVLTIEVFSALASASPESRVEMLVAAAKMSAPAFAARDLGWLLALLPAGIVGVIALKRIKPTSGRIAGATLALLIFVLAPALNLLALKAVELPSWAEPASPWQADPGFVPPVVSGLACEHGGDGAPDAVIGLRHVSFDGRYAGDIAQPNVQQQLPGWFGAALKGPAGQPGFLSRGPSKVLRLAVDERLTAPYLALVLRSAEAAGAEKVELVGVEMPVKPVDPTPAGDLHPLLVVYGHSAGGRICAMPVGLGAPPTEGSSFAQIWRGHIGAADQVQLALLSKPLSDSAKRTSTLDIPSRSQAHQLPRDSSHWPPGEAPLGLALFTADQTVTAGKMILAAAAIGVEGLATAFPDPARIPPPWQPPPLSADELDGGALDDGREPSKLGGPVKKKGKVRVGPSVIKGALPKDQVERVVRRRLASIRNCYEKQLAVKPDLAGRVVVKYIISPDGAVKLSQAQDSTLDNSKVEICMAQTVRRFRFPPPEGGGIVVVTTPFMLSPR